MFFVQDSHGIENCSFRFCCFVACILLEVMVQRFLLPSSNFFLLKGRKIGKWKWAWMLFSRITECFGMDLFLRCL